MKDKKTPWTREPHIAAKHQVLGAYVDGWLGVMASQALKFVRPGAPRPRLLLLDGFAGPGRYADGGSAAAVGPRVRSRRFSSGSPTG